MLVTSSGIEHFRRQRQEEGEVRLQIGRPGSGRRQMAESQLGERRGVRDAAVQGSILRFLLTVALNSYVGFFLVLVVFLIFRSAEADARGKECGDWSSWLGQEATLLTARPPQQRIYFK